MVKVKRQPLALKSKTLRLSIHCGTSLAACALEVWRPIDQDDGAGAAQRRSPHQPEVSRLPLDARCLLHVRPTPPVIVRCVCVHPLAFSILKRFFQLFAALHFHEAFWQFSVLKCGSVLFTLAFCALSALPSILPNAVLLFRIAFGSFHL